MFENHAATYEEASGSVFLPVFFFLKSTMNSNHIFNNIFNYVFFLPWQFDNWKDCEKLIWQHSGLLKRLFVKVHNHFKNLKTDEHIWATYSTKECHSILQERFPHPSTTETELEFPIAYAILVYKGGPLLEQLLQAIYMPHNLYCLHIDVKASDTFKHAVKSMTRCLDNVFITKNSVDVIWGHISIVQAQLNCRADLLESPHC